MGHATLRPRSVPVTTDRASLSLDAYVVDTLMPDLVGHDKCASALLVYLLLWRRSIGVGRASAQLSLRDIAEGTGLSRRGVQQALNVLHRRQLVAITRASVTAVPTYDLRRPWRR